MPRVCLFHWKAEEAKPLMTVLQAAGFSVDYHERMAGYREVRDHPKPPDAIVIDLSRMPSHGRELGIFFALPNPDYWPTSRAALTLQRSFISGTKRARRAYFGVSYLHGCAAPERTYVKLAASHLYAVHVIDLKLRESARSQSFRSLSRFALASTS